MFEKGGRTDLKEKEEKERLKAWKDDFTALLDKHRGNEVLRDEFKTMEKAKMTPRDFGLCVRSHPETLIVTARNKMRSGQSIIRQISLEGRLVETATLIKSENVVSENHKALTNLLGQVPDSSKPPITENQPGFLLKDIPVAAIETFLSEFINHPASQKSP